MRRVIALIAAALLVLTIAGPVAADPTARQSRLTDVYVTTCPGGIAFDQFAYGVPGWDIEWAPGDTPWLLMGYTLTRPDGSSYTRPLPPGLDGNGTLLGPCEITAVDFPGYLFTDAWFLHR